MRLSDVGFWEIAPLFVLPWGTVVGFASVAIVMRRRGGFALAMICHLLLAIPGLALLFVLGVSAFWCLGAAARETQSFAALWFLLFLVLLPFVVISGWAFFYLRKIRKCLVTIGSLGG